MDHRFGRGAVDQRPFQVLRFENFAEFLRTPVLDQELQPGLGPKSSVAVVAEQADHRLPDVRHLFEGHPCAETLTQHRVGGQSATDPQIQPGPMFGVVDPDKSHVVDLVDDVLQAADRGLELARQVGVLRLSDVAAHDLLDRRCRVEHLVEGLAGKWGPEHDAGAVAARFGGLQTDLVEATPDLGHVLDPDPVVLDVLPVGDVGGVPRELGGNLAQRAQRPGGQRATVAAHPQHEIRGFDEIDILLPGEGPVVSLFALGIQAPPAQSAAEVGLVDAVEALLGIDLLDAGPHVERVLHLLELLVGVEGFAVAQSPLAVVAGLGRLCHERCSSDRGAGV